MSRRDQASWAFILSYPIPKDTSSKTHPKKMTTTWRSENQKKVAYVLHLQIDNFFKIVEKQMGPDYLDDIYFASHVIQALATQKVIYDHYARGSTYFLKSRARDSISHSVGQSVGWSVGPSHTLFSCIFEHLKIFLNI